MDVVNLWWPRFGLATGIRIACALASVPTAILFAGVTPSLARNIRSFIEVLDSTQKQRDTAEGALTAAEVIARERKRAAHDLAALNEQLHSVMNSTTDYIVQVDREWRILYGNHKALSTLPDFQLGRDFWTCFPSLLSTAAEQQFRRSMETETEESFETYFEPHKRWYRVHEE
jgi:PAS domain-containing protein